MCLEINATREIVINNRPVATVLQSVGPRFESVWGHQKNHYHIDNVTFNKVYVL